MHGLADAPAQRVNRRNFGDNTRGKAVKKQPPLQQPLAHTLMGAMDVSGGLLAYIAFSMRSCCLSSKPKARCFLAMTCMNEGGG
jgi:hypothetical protein